MLPLLPFLLCHPKPTCFKSAPVVGQCPSVGKFDCSQCRASEREQIWHWQHPVTGATKELWQNSGAP